MNVKIQSNLKPRDELRRKDKVSSIIFDKKPSFFPYIVH